MSECEMCQLLLERIEDLEDCKRSHQDAAGRLAKRNCDLREEIAYLEAQLNGRAEIGI